MGATTHKSFRNIIDSKYSFTHPKSHLPLQISVWRFTEEQLETGKQCIGQSLKYPFKFYSDQGYIITTITNHNIIKQNPPSSTNLNLQIGDVKATVSMLQILYSFFHNEIEQYFVQEIVLQSESKYVNEVLSLKLYIYVGQNLSSEAKIKLMSYSVLFSRYVTRGGLCSISKLYHQYQETAQLQNEIKVPSSPSKQQEYYVTLNTLIQEQGEKQPIKKIKKSDQVEKDIIHQKLSKYSLLNKIFFQDFLQLRPNRIDIFQNRKAQRKQPLYIICQVTTNKKLVLKGLDQAKEVKRKVEVQKQELQMNESLPFQCEITEINIKDKKANAVEQSNIMDELSVLNEKPYCQFVKVTCEEDDFFVLTDYTSIRDSKKCTEFNAQLIINLAPHSCYNYYLNQINYTYYYLSPIPIKPPADAVLFQYNIQHIILQITQTIMHLTSNNKANNAYNNRVVIHSIGSVFSDENCAVVIGYLMARYLYSYQKAFSVMNKHYKLFKQNESEQLLLNKIYADQLLTLQGRLSMASVPNYGVSINLNNWRVYQVSNNHSCPGQSLISRFIGQIANPNQLTSLPNSNHHCYIVLSHQLVGIITQMVEKWQKQSSMKIPQGIKGISVYLGKQFEPKLKELFLNKCKKSIPLILRYQFLNRNKRTQTFNNQFCYKFIQNIVAANIQVQIIEKSFRKAQLFTPLSIGFGQDNPAQQIQKVTLPHNPKEKLTFKYPYLRPMWQNIKDDEYYFVVQISKGGAQVKVIKGKNWSGLEVDKQLYFQNIVKLYLKSISEQKIWVNQEGDQSLFNDPLDN